MNQNLTLIGRGLSVQSGCVEKFGREMLRVAVLTCKLLYDVVSPCSSNQEVSCRDKSPRIGSLMEALLYRFLLHLQVLRLGRYCFMWCCSIAIHEMQDFCIKFTA